MHIIFGKHDFSVIFPKNQVKISLDRLSEKSEISDGYFFMPKLFKNIISCRRNQQEVIWTPQSKVMLEIVKFLENGSVLDFTRCPNHAVSTRADIIFRT